MWCHVCYFWCSVKCTHRIRVTFKRNVSTSPPKKSDIVIKSELVIKTCSVNAARVSMMARPSLWTAWEPSCWFCCAFMRMSFSLTCASAVVYLLMDLSSDDASVCLSVTPFSGFHPIKSWLKRWQTWHTLFIILMSRLSLADELKASRS